MAIERGTRFGVGFDQVFPSGALMQGEIVPDMEYVSNEDAARGKRPNQRKDEQTGLLQWKALVSDPSAAKERDASVTVTLLAEVQPVPPEAIEVVPGMRVRPVEFTDLTVEPRVMGDKFKYQGYTVRAKGITAPRQGINSGGGMSSGSPSAPAPKSNGGNGKSAQSGEKPAGAEKPAA